MIKEKEIENKQWKQIGFMLDLMEICISKLEVWGLYKKHDAKVIRNAIRRGWSRIHNYDKETSQESKNRFNKLFPESK